MEKAFSSKIQKEESSGMQTVTNIQWDTDGEDVGLPTTVQIPDDIKADDIADHLSDTFCFCVFSFQVEDTASS